MHIRLLLAFFVALVIGCGKSPSSGDSLNDGQKLTIPKEFCGHFVSDRDATITRWQGTQPWGGKTTDMIEKLGPILGTTEIISAGTRYTLISGDWKEEGVSEFLSINGTTAEVKSYSTVWKRDIVSRLEADSEGYWVYADHPVKGYCERFS